MKSRELGRVNFAPRTCGDETEEGAVHSTERQDRRLSWNTRLSIYADPFLFLENFSIPTQRGVGNPVQSPASDGRETASVSWIPLR